MENAGKYSATKKTREILENLLRQIDSHENSVWAINDYNIVAKQAVEIIRIAFDEVMGKQLEDSLPMDNQTQSIYDTGANARSIGIGKIKGQLVGLLNCLDSEEEAKKTLEASVSYPNSIFLVHGHDKEAKETVARLIEKLGLKCIILHEQPNKGKAIIDKLEINAEGISFAIVLLTPDDKCAQIDSDEYKSRARQNVIYELGFF